MLSLDEILFCKHCIRRLMDLQDLQDQVWIFKIKLLGRESGPGETLSLTEKNAQVYVL